MMKLRLFLFVLGITQARSNDCSITLGNNVPEFPPIVTNEIGEFILPDGDEDNRYFTVLEGEIMMVSCPGTEFDHETIWEDGPVFARCTGGENFDVWVPETQDDPDNLKWRDLGCRRQPYDSVEVIGECGPSGEGTEIRIGFQVSDETRTVTVTVCHDLVQSRTLWSQHSLYDEIDARDHSNDSPSFKPDSFFDYDVNHFYTMATQKETIADLVGSQELADEYVQDFSSGKFLARGHLAPNADFMFYSWMDSTYHFINVAPQWNIFNSGNWMYMENELRDFVISRGIDVTVYTGTHEVCELADVNGDMVEIFLYNGDMLPVPRYYWKIVHDPESNAGFAVIGVNNPHLKSLPDDYLFCDSVEDHPILADLSDPNSLEKGYVWVCRVEDLAAVLSSSPELGPMDLLT